MHESATLYIGAGRHLHIITNRDSLIVIFKGLFQFAVIAMSATVASESCFLSALQPNTAVTTYAVPSDVQLGPRGSIIDEVERAKRVQQQVHLRLAEKRSSSLTRLNGSNCISPGGQFIIHFSLCPILEM